MAISGRMRIDDAIIHMDNSSKRVSTVAFVFCQAGAGTALRGCPCFFVIRSRYERDADYDPTKAEIEQATREPNL